ncbi:MAG: hypothetical protein V1781_01020 [Bacteroidota bacterium]
MNLAIYTRNNTADENFNEAMCLRIVLMYAKHVAISSFISSVLIYWHWKDTWNELHFCRLHELIYNQHYDSGKCIKIYNLLKEIRNNKNKNKEIIVIQYKMESHMKKIKKDVSQWFTNFIDAYKITPLLQLCKESQNDIKQKANNEELEKEGLTLMNYEEYTEETKGEDTMIKNIVDSFLEYDENLILDEMIEKLVPYTRLDEKEIHAESFFFSIQLFEFPHVQDLDHNQIGNIRDELFLTVNPLHQDLIKLKKELASVQFENSQEQIQTLLNSNISPHLEKIQIKIDENIYIQQQKNRYTAEQRIKVLIGITSVENVIQLLEKKKVILPFVAGDIIEKLEKNINIKSCVPFIYHKFPPKISSQ